MAEAEIADLNQKRDLMQKALTAEKGKLEAAQHTAEIF